MRIRWIFQLFCLCAILSSHIAHPENIPMYPITLHISTYKHMHLFRVISTCAYIRRYLSNSKKSNSKQNLLKLSRYEKITLHTFVLFRRNIKLQEDSNVRFLMMIEQEQMRLYPLLFHDEKLHHVLKCGVIGYILILKRQKFQIICNEKSKKIDCSVFYM